ncbi:MAG: hypothetical protein ACOX5E_05835 [Bacilli bacterium]|jgi:hypothetical protein
MDKIELNEIYKKLEFKSNELSSPFSKIHNVFEYTVAYYSGHYNKNNDGNYQIDYFPIPVISIKNYCDIEVGLDGVSLSTKLKKADALKFDYNKIKQYKFEVYGVEDYLKDYYVEGNTIEELLNNIKLSKEKDIGFAFKLDKNIDGDSIYKFVKFLRRNGFFY